MVSHTGNRAGGAGQGLGALLNGKLPLEENTFRGDDVLWCHFFRSLSINIFIRSEFFHFDQEGITFSEFNAGCNYFPMKAVLSPRAVFAMCERSPNAVGTLLSEKLL